MGGAQKATGTENTARLVALRSNTRAAAMSLVKLQAMDKEIGQITFLLSVITMVIY